MVYQGNSDSIKTEMVLWFVCEMTLGDHVFGHMVSIVLRLMRPLGDKAL